VNVWAKALLVLLVALALAWGLLRLFRPELEKKHRAKLVVGASALGGFALAVVTLGAYKRKPKEDPPPVTVDPTEVLEEIEERFDTDDNFEEELGNADTLDPVPPRGDSLSDELADFRAGSDELLK